MRELNGGFSLTKPVTFSNQPRSTVALLIKLSRVLTHRSQDPSLTETPKCLMTTARKPQGLRGTPLTRPRAFSNTSLKETEALVRRRHLHRTQRQMMELSCHEAKR